MAFDVFSEVAALRSDRTPFVLATVVHRRAPSSGQLGAKAVILGDGSMLGWLGGACAEPTVLRQAREALSDGAPRLLRLGDADAFGSEELDDTVVVPMACESEGALEVFLEPIIPAPQVVVIGRSPMVHTLTALTLALGWDCAVVDDGGRAENHPHPELVRCTLDLGSLGITPSSAVVVATQGHYDDLALASALATDAGYIGLVAAEKRSSALLEQLRADGFDEVSLARIEAPAGLDLGRVPNAEIAVSILAGLVARRAAGELGISQSSEPPPAAEATDPVCGMTVVVDDAKYHASHEGANYWFCAPGCLRAFQADPASFVGQR